MPRTWNKSPIFLGSPLLGFEADLGPPRTLFVRKDGLDRARNLVRAYKQGEIGEMTPELWTAKKIVDSTLHPDTGEPVFLPWRMSCAVLVNFVVTAGMLMPGLQVCSRPQINP